MFYSAFGAEVLRTALPICNCETFWKTPANLIYRMSKQSGNIVVLQGNWLNYMVNFSKQSRSFAILPKSLRTLQLISADLFWTGQDSTAFLSFSYLLTLWGLPQNVGIMKYV